MAKNTEYYCAGFLWNGHDPANQLERFQRDGIWENGFDDKYIDTVKNVSIGSQIAAKTSYTRKFDGKIISVLEVHNIGTVTENPEDGKRLKVDWRKDFTPFTLDGRGAYRSTISKVNDPENIELIFGNKKKKENASLRFDELHRQREFPLNQILFGPPGTGKTYRTINKAISIIDNLRETALYKYYGERGDLKNRFDELLIDDWENPYGQIAFITFHQSMSYEDFIEGIKPGLDNNQKVIYNLEPGIFKMIASLARDNWLDAVKGVKENLSFEEAFVKFKEEWQENMDIKFPMKREGKDFTVIGVTKSSIRFKKASGGTGHTLSISTLRDLFYRRREVRQTGVGIYYPAILDKLKSYRPALVIEKEQKNYVLIIDEINRGNISQIFGELITLLEDDKRLGKAEALELTLPYSKEKFGVPPNLYIIGTMNTADRSVEALDTALRRRFSFEEMAPRHELLLPQRKIWQFWWDDPYIQWEEEPYKSKEHALYKLLGISGDNYPDDEIWHKMKKEGKNESQISDLDGIEFRGINLSKLLTTINKRIEKLLDKDHQIGHSYFMPVFSIPGLIEAFENKIIPLLQEYFFGDYGKIGLVLGRGFIEQEETIDGELFADFPEYDSSGLSEKNSYRVKAISNMTEEEFTYAIAVLLKQ